MKAKEGERMEPFVFFKVFGGLGNQMFEYAAAYAVAKTKNAKLYLQACSDNAHNVKGHNYVQKLFTDGIECEGAPGPHSQYSQGDSPFFPWDPRTPELPCRMDGYFQFYPAIAPVLPELVEKFRKALNVGETDPKTVLLHVRRGDYVPKANFHFLQGPEYYLNAYIALAQRIQKMPERVLCFSDDIEWCKQQEWLRVIPKIEFYENEDELETLAEMARCGGGAIIGNSTFSWWGAMMSGTEYVYYPSRWIGLHIYDLFPGNWVCI